MRCTNPRLDLTKLQFLDNRDHLIQSAFASWGRADGFKGVSMGKKAPPKKRSRALYSKSDTSPVELATAKLAAAVV